MSKILHLDQKPKLTSSAYKKIAKFENLILPENVSDEVILKEIRNAKYVISGARYCGIEYFKIASNLIAVVLPSAGYDYIDVEAATKNGIYVINAPRANSNAVAEISIGLMLAVARNISQSCQKVLKGQWVDEKIRNESGGFELTGKTLGVIGLGNIGSRIIELSRAFSMEAICYTRRPSQERECKLGVKFVSLDMLMKQADFVVICAALNPSTLGLVGEKQISLMKKTAFLINTARGKIVDYKALYKALSKKSIAGAGLDVLYSEPPGANHPFFKLDNVVITPHLGSRTREANERISHLVVDEILRLELGKRPLHPVNQIYTKK